MQRQRVLTDYIQTARNRFKQTPGTISIEVSQRFGAGINWNEKLVSEGILFSKYPGPSLRFPNTRVLPTLFGYLLSFVLKLEISRQDRSGAWTPMGLYIYSLQI